jgi:hypothetical protein
MFRKKGSGIDPQVLPKGFELVRAGALLFGSWGAGRFSV